MDNQPRQSKSSQKSTGSKDAKSLKANKNRDLEAPPMPDMSDASPESTDLESFQPWQRMVIRLQAQGWSLNSIVGKGVAARKALKDKRQRRGFAALPNVVKLYLALSEQPEFRVACRSAFSFSVDSVAEETLKLSRSLDQVPGLKKSALVDARYKRILSTLNIAGRIVPDRWGDETEGESNIVIIDAGLGIIKAHNPPGSADGQNAAALKAGRWEEIRKVAGDA